MRTRHSTPTAWMSLAVSHGLSASWLGWTGSVVFDVMRKWRRVHLASMGGMEMELEKGNGSIPAR